MSLHTHCRLREQGKGPYYGGELVDQTVNAVFAALIWHCQDLREELSMNSDPSQLLLDAFSTAEGLRRELVDTHIHIHGTCIYTCTLQMYTYSECSVNTWR